MASVLCERGSMHWVQSENRFERARRNEHEAVTEVCGREREWRLCVTFVVCARQVKAGDGTLKPLPTSLSAPLYFLFLCLFPQRRDKQTWLVADSSRARAGGIDPKFGDEILYRYRVH